MFFFVVAIAVWRERFTVRAIEYKKSPNPLVMFLNQYITLALSTFIRKHFQMWDSPRNCCNFLPWRCWPNVRVIVHAHLVLTQEYKMRSLFAVVGGRFSLSFSSENADAVMVILQSTSSHSLDRVEATFWAVTAGMLRTIPPGPAKSSTLDSSLFNIRQWSTLLQITSRVSMHALALDLIELHGKFRYC